MRSTLAAAAALAVTALAAPLAPAHASSSAVGPNCTLIFDPTELRSDVASLVVTGGPVVVAETGVTSVTVSCVILTDGAEYRRIAATRRGNVGFVSGRTSVGTFSGPVISICTEVTWTGGSNGRRSDCNAS